jgi:hypothetical protein
MLSEWNLATRCSEKQWSIVDVRESYERNENNTSLARQFSVKNDRVHSEREERYENPRCGIGQHQ